MEMIYSTNYFENPFKRGEKAKQNFVWKTTVNVPEKVSQFDKIKKLDNNWDNYGAKKFSKSFLELAKKFSEKLIFIGKIVPASDGSIQFEYSNEDGQYLEVAYYSNEKIEYYFSNSKKEIEKTTTIDEIKNINQDILKIYYGK